MRRETPFWRRYTRLFGPNLEADIDDEVGHHIELLVNHFSARGLSAGEARALAERRFGNVGTVKSDCAKIAQRRQRAMARAELIDRLMQDVRFAVRTFVRTPAFTVAALLTLAVGIGANTAVFTVVNAVLLRPLPYSEPERVISVWTRYVPESGQDFEFSAVSVPEYRDYRATAKSMEEVAAYRFIRVNLAGGAGAPDRIASVAATANFFDVFGVNAALGRTFRPGEDAVGAPCVLVMGDGLWRARFGASRGVLNQTLRVDGEVCTIIGVMPPGFFFPIPETRLWRPFQIDADPDLASDRESHWINAVGRLRPDATLEQAQSELQPMMAGWREEHAHHQGHFVVLQSFREDLVGSDRAVLLVMLGGVALVLLIICGNLANLLLARAEGRRREIAVRVALGASRGRLVRQLLTESLLLAGAGGLGALAIAPLLLRLLVSLDPNALPIIADVHLDARVLGFTALVSIGTGALFGLIPAFQLTRLELQETLKTEGRASTASRTSLAARRALVVLEVALCLTIVVAAGLLVRSYQRVTEVPLGFNPEGVLAMDITLPAVDYADPSRVQRFYAELRAAVADLPGVESAGLLSGLPFRTQPPDDSYRIEGRPDPQPGEPSVSGGYLLTTPGWFETMRIPLVRGRTFDARDVRGAPLVAVIDETAVREHWAGQDPIGKRIRYYGPDSAWITVVGVVGSARYVSPTEEPRANVYVPHAQMPRGFYTGHALTLVVRGSTPPDRFIPAVRDLLRRIDPSVPITRVAAMEDVIARATGRPRVAAGLMGLFGVVALLVGALGVYGILSYMVQARTNEIGIRMALGANAGTVRLQVLRQGMGLTLAGIALGTLVTLASARVLTDLLFGVRVNDFATYGATIGVLLAVALLASWLPARRATRVDPLSALRS